MSDFDISTKALILGGIKSGKSRRAEQLAAELSEAASIPVCYIATAQALDDEMHCRIAHHKASRPSIWRTIEEGISLGKVIAELDAPQVVLVDCLTRWLTNLLMAQDDTLLEKELRSFESEQKQTTYPIILVSNETNMGMVPMDALSRKFCDQAGVLHQRLAQICNRVELVVAGLPMTIKGS